VTPEVGLRPSFRDQQSRISSRQIERLTNGVSRQIDAVNGFGELSRESHPHFYRQSDSNGHTGFARNAESVWFRARFVAGKCGWARAMLIRNILPPRESPPMTLRLRIPDPCPRCGANGSVTLEQTIMGRDVTLRWCCKSCRYEWRVTDTATEGPDRRTNPMDRRKMSRTDRRTNSDDLERSM